MRGVWLWHTLHNVGCSSLSTQLKHYVCTLVQAKRQGDTPVLDVVVAIVSAVRLIDVITIHGHICPCPCKKICNILAYGESLHDVILMMCSISILVSMAKTCTWNPHEYLHSMLMCYLGSAHKFSVTNYYCSSITSI